MIDTDLWSENTRELYSYWCELAPGLGMIPGRQHLDPNCIKNILPYVWLMDVEGEPPNYRYRLVGTGLVVIIPASICAKCIPNLKPTQTRFPS